MSKIHGIPVEVWEAWAILKKPSIGEYLYNKVQGTIKKYPGYFAQYIESPPKKVAGGYEYTFKIMKTGPSVLQYLKDGEYAKYNPYTEEAFESTKKMNAEVLEYMKAQRDIKLNNRGSGYYINAKLYAPALR